MATSEHGDEAEGAAPVAHNPRQSPLKHAFQDAQPEGSLSIVRDTLDETAHEGEKILTGQILGAFYHYYASIQNLTLSPDKISSPKKQESTISSSERPLENSTAFIDDERKVQGVINVPQGEGPSESTYHTPMLGNSD